MRNNVVDLFEYKRSNFSPEKLSDSDYDEIFTKEAANHSSFKELEEATDSRLLPELTKWANKISLDKNKLRGLFSAKVDNK